MLKTEVDELRAEAKELGVDIEATATESDKESVKSEDLEALTVDDDIDVEESSLAPADNPSGLQLNSPVKMVSFTAENDSQQAPSEAKTAPESVGSGHSDLLPSETASSILAQEFKKIMSEYDTICVGTNKMDLLNQEMANRRWQP